MIDYQLKSECIVLDVETNIIADINALSKYQYQLEYGLIDFDWYINSNYLQLIRQRIDDFAMSYPNHYAEYSKIIHADFERKRRLRNRIQEMIDKRQDVVFATFTFRPEYLLYACDTWRRDIVMAYVKSITDVYVGNIDFGKINGHEHYHFVLGNKVDKLLLQEFAYKFGNIDVELVRKSTTDFKKLATYITKLTNHALKVTTKRQALIYSRKKF